MAQGLLGKLKALQQGDPCQAMWAKRFFCSIKEVGLFLIANASVA